MLENKADLQVIINNHNGLCGTVIPLQIEARNAFTLIRLPNICVLSEVLFKCVECTDYNLCCSCATNQKHAKHIVIRVTDPKVFILQYLFKFYNQLYSIYMPFKNVQMNLETVLKRLMVSPRLNLNAGLGEFGGSKQCYATTGECRKFSF